MSASTVKGDRKREIGQLPIKKKFRDSTISREDIDEAIANGIKLAFKEQQSTLDSVVTSAVRDAVDSVLIPALRKLREDIQAGIPSLKGRNIEIDRAHRVYDGRKNSERPRTLIFRVLRWHDRLEILKGARQAYPVKCT